MSLKNQVGQTGILVYFKLDFYCLFSLQKSSLNLTKNQVQINRKLVLHKFDCTNHIRLLTFLKNWRFFCKKLSFSNDSTEKCRRKIDPILFFLKRLLALKKLNKNHKIATFLDKYYIHIYSVDSIKCAVPKLLLKSLLCIQNIEVIFCLISSMYCFYALNMYW